MLYALFLTATPASAVPFWVVSLGHLQSTRLDPVVSPGAVSGHVHEVVGGSAFSPVYDYTKLRSSKCTTANLDIDLSNYWAPQMYRKTQGGLKLVENTYTNVYYNTVRKGTEAIYEFPPGFRMLAGDPNRITHDPDNLADDSVRYTCLNFEEGSHETPAFPDHQCPDGLRADIFFPTCWDGQHAWLEGSKHVVYGEGGNNAREIAPKCPSTHPYRLMKLLYEFHYIDTDQPYAPGNRVLANGDTVGYSFHADFTNGWEEGIFGKIFNEGEGCNAFFELEKCPIFREHLKEQGVCAPEGVEVDEDVGKETILRALPGNSPLFGPEGSSRDKSYVETAKFRQIGGRGRSDPQPVSAPVIPATVRRKITVKGDPGHTGESEIVNLNPGDNLNIGGSVINNGPTRSGLLTGTASSTPSSSAIQTDSRPHWCSLGHSRNF